MEQPRFKTSLWLYFAVITVIVIVAAATRWSFEHPYGTSWDESIYLNEILIDAQRLVHGMLLKLGGRILIKSYGRPPAYRILGLPFLVIFGFHTASARLTSLACFALSAWFIYQTTRRLSGQAAGAFAVLIFSLSPIVVSASMWFSTEGPLYLATSAFLYYVLLCWTDRSESSRNWIGLGLAVGLGFLSKASFAAIAFPVLAFWFVAGRRSYLGVQPITSQRKAGLLALLIAAPWWLLNIKPAVFMVQTARGFVANSLGTPSLATWIKWFNTVLQSLLGVGLSVLIGLVAIVFIRKVILGRESILDPAQRAALGACACAGLPIVLAQLSGTNHLLRHISPAVIPLAIAVGVLAEKAGWMNYRAAMAASGVLSCAQLIMIVAPVLFPNNGPITAEFVNGQLPWTVMTRRDQWDWSPVRNLSYDCGVGSPRISFLGGGVSFTPPAIQFPWAAKPTPSPTPGTLDYPDVSQLWRYEEGPLDWQKVMELAGQSDIVLTAPRYMGAVYPDPLNNQYNAEFADRVSTDARFQGPFRFTMGRFAPVEVSVFVNKSLVCHWEQPAPATR